MSDKAIGIGYLGKVPFLGDFVQEGVCQQFSEHWEHWLQAAIAVSKEQLGAQWQERYLTSPVWHFALSENLITSSAKKGTLLPSVDAVGRHYPFTVLVDSDSTPIATLNSNQLSLDYEDAGLSVLDDSADLSLWQKKVMSTLKESRSPAKIFSKSLSPDENKSAVVFEFQGDELGGGTVDDVLHSLLLNKYGDYSVWWTHGSIDIKPVVFVTAGLPPVNQVAAMLDGRWQHWEWNYTQVSECE
ncbi:type VI secretion system-associated protein TagF [uncultured Pseudoalteromonas sp.]|uniref:type VI secretion system-associated protein TagF n=1 Tax=uncultured Pseudoalteromonas sp. TaxID=114053 RepID=UPI002622A630|nr:type VI secretion system-associated protein TagF [uncultured Pseudoalteromonas sp.]